MTEYLIQEIKRLIETGIRLGFTKNNIINEIYCLINKDKCFNIKKFKEAEKLYNKYKGSK